MGFDALEKDIATGDLNKDGLDDIIVVRKNPFSNPGAGADLLLMNTGSNLEDQTALFAPEFISNPSDSRDVFIGDFDNDTWPDVVIANTFEDQPIFYHNKGMDSLGNWLGLVDESSTRLPIVLENDVLQFCALWAGDVTGNGALDIYFSNYNPNGGSNDVLLINDGNGVFTDETVSRMGNLRRSAFGTSAEIHDMDNDGDNDIVKISTLYEIEPWNAQGVFILFNEGDGTFTDWVQVPGEAPYMFTVADFNQDGLKDLYVVDDNPDYINMAVAIDPDNSISYETTIIPDQRANFFGGNVKLADLDNNGYLDIGLADVDVDIPPCESGFGSPRKFTLMQNTMGAISAPYGLNYYPWNESTYDFAFIDLNQDGLQDLFLGRCEGYEVFLNSATAVDCSISIEGINQLCNGATTSLSASSETGTYNWSTGQTEQTITITEPGIYCLTVTDTEGCADATCVEVLAATDTEAVLDVSICEGESYAVGEEVYTETGTYQTVLTNVAGCDSMVTLNLFIIPASLTENIAQICEGEVYVIGNSSYTQSGDYLDFLISSEGCDSLVLTSLTVNPSYSTALEEEICSGEFFEFAGQVFSTTGVYEIALTTQEGCDSTFLLNLTVLDASETFLSAQICAGSSFEAGGMSFDESGDYTISLFNSAGCDSTLNLSLEVQEQLASEFNAEICEGEVYIIQDQSFTEAGAYEIVFTAAGGCDSIVTVNLALNAVSEQAINASICNGDTLDFNSMLLTEAGEYQAILTNAVGCDSTVNLTLSIIEIPIIVQDFTICEGETVEVGGTIYNQEGFYEITLISEAGCDSLINLSIFVSEPADTIIDALLCEGETIQIEDQVFDQSGSYEVATIANNGCDSLITLNLDYVEATAFIETTICAGDSLIIGGTVFNEENPDGEIILEGASVAGCDSVVVVGLSFTPEILLEDSTVIAVTDVLGQITVDIGGGVEPYSFLWSNGAVSQNLTSLAPGDYTLTVTDSEGCTAEFNFFVPQISSVLNDPLYQFGLTAFPNPSPGVVIFELTNPPALNYNFIVYDVLGRKVHQSNQSGEKFVLQLPEATGTYFYQLNFGEGIIFSGRLVKQE